MKRNVCIICGLLLFMILHCGCSEDSTRIKENNGFQLSMDGDVTRSEDNIDILKNMRLYCFSQGGNELSGQGGSWDSHFDHQLLGVTRTEMTLHAKAMRTGDWDLVMVSAAGAELTPPISARSSSQSLMYTYEPGDTKPDGSQNDAHQIWHRMLRLPTVVEGQKTEASCGITRNAAMVRVVVDRGVDIDTDSSAEHWFKLHGVPNKLSWSGTFLKTVTPGVYETSLNEPDVLEDPLTGKFAFTDNSTVETGTYKSDTLTFIIPAHREADFWADNTTANTNVKDTITHKMSLSVSFTKASGGTFEKTVDINSSIQCNRILLLHLVMKDVNLELTTSVTPWEPDQKVGGDFEAPYLNVSDLETTVYDGAASRIYFWTNQPEDSVFVLEKGGGVTNVNAVFDRLAGPDAINRYYDTTEKSGYIDIASLDLMAGQPDAKIYLKAGSLLREITVKRSVSEQAQKKIATPYVGTFHRANQRGERVVTWSHTGEWTAYLENPAGSDATIDRLPSPSFADGTLYGTSPSNAEMGIVSNNATSVTGMNTIYFRVGWGSMHSAAAEPRYATVTVRKGTNEPNGDIIQTLYLRQGEKASVVYPRTGAALFSPYNLTGNGPLILRGGSPTEYPSQCGAYFQWMDVGHPRYAYAASGTVSSSYWNATPPFYETYWTEESPGMADTYEVCPSGYRRVSDGNTSGEPTGTSELRESLWANPTAESATNTYMGYYADGYFDRHAIVSSSTGVANSAVCPGNEVAYRGRLFYNTTTKASLFFPAAGQRLLTNGALANAGQKGYYWTASSTIKTEIPTGSQAYVTTELRNVAVNIRCVAQ